MCAQDGDLPFFQGLPEDFQAAAIELGQFVEEEGLSQADLWRDQVPKLVDTQPRAAAV